MGIFLTAYDERECPEARHKRAGDEVYDICNLNDKICLLVSGDKCEYFEEYLEEDK